MRKQVLVIDNNSYHFEIIRQQLKDGQPRMVITRAFDVDQALNLIKSRRFDLILSEFYNQDKSDWIKDLQKQSRRIPLVILTTQRDEQKAVSAMKKGADDYLIKNNRTSKNLKFALVKAIAKKKKSKASQQPNSSSMNIIANSLKNLSDILSQPQKSWEKSRKKFYKVKELKILETEIEKIKGMMKNLVN